MAYWQALLIGLVLYIISLAIALSPIGEWILRLQTGCTKISRVEQINFIEPIFREVYGRAKQLDPTIPDDVELFINDDEEPNAFATGRKTICVTAGLLQAPEDQIKATLGHEFGHLAHKDTDLILVVTIGNFIVTALITFIKIMVMIFKVICSFVSEGLAGVISAVVTLIFIDGAMWVWSKIGTALVMKSSRSNEFEADEFSFNLGYGDSLCALLDSFQSSGKKGLFAMLASSHPDKDDRIARLQELGSAYRAACGSNVASQPVYTAQPVSVAVAPQAQVQLQPQAFQPQVQPQPQAFQPQSQVQPQPQAFQSVTGFTPAKAIVEEKKKNTVLCASCGAEIIAGSRFCQKCGAMVGRTQPPKTFCPNCGIEIMDNDSVFCAECGARLIK
jgi:heat shock protein HtpX